MTIAQLRHEYHQQICDKIVRTSLSKKTGTEYPNFADADNRNSIKIATRIVELLACQVSRDDRKDEGAIGTVFEEVTKDYLNRAFQMLRSVRPGDWYFARHVEITDFDQYSHLAEYAEALTRVKAIDKGLVALLKQLLGHDYIVAPDIVVARMPLDDAEINQSPEPVLAPEDEIAKLTPLRKANLGSPRGILHASISCKWTVRSDRAQNTRTEALNLIRNRKGNLPHVVAITAEPLPTRISSLALGTGDLDCVYHFALTELQQAVKDVQAEDQQDMLNDLIQGRRLRDIADLPFDLAV